MGVFLEVSAFKDRSVEEVVRHIVAYARKHDVSCEVIAPADSDRDYRDKYDEDTDALVYAMDNGWTIVFWMDKFCNDQKICADLSGEMNTIVSTVHIYDGDYWVHALFDSGKLVDLFCSMPDYFAETEDEAERLAVKYAGSSQAIAKVFSISPEVIAPYLVHVTAENKESLGKAHPDDECDLLDCWVFVDFWKRLGIHYPGEMDSHKQRLRFGGDMEYLDKKLPNSEDYEL